MVILARAMTITGLKEKLDESEPADVLGGFADLSLASNWAIGGIADSVQAGIITGRDDTHLAPGAYVSRAEAAAMIQRLLSKSDLI